LIAGATLWFLTPAKLQPAIAEIVLPDDLDTWLETGERQAIERYGLVPDTEKRIIWAGDSDRTPYSVLYLHGFSATRQETAPLAEIVASTLGANLFETRLTGHGRKREALTDVRAEDWLQDAAEALTIASRLGERVIVIGTSTGATLAAAMLGHPAMDVVDILVMISPNFAPRDPGASWLTRPAGPFLAQMLVGDMRSWQPHNEKQARYWSTSYPTASAVEMMRLVDLANRKLPDAIPQRLLMFYSLEDAVISPTEALSVFQRTAAPQKTAIEIVDPGDPSHHVLAGDVLSNENTRRIANNIVAFILRPAL
jgi:esterase/lipase